MLRLWLSVQMDNRIEVTLQIAEIGEAKRVFAKLIVHAFTAPELVRVTEPAVSVLPVVRVADVPQFALRVGVPPPTSIFPAPFTAKTVALVDEETTANTSLVDKPAAPLCYEP